MTSRDRRSISRVWALWFAGLLCYIPANLYPMLVTSAVGKTSGSTIVGGAVELAQHGDILVAAVILIASVAIPSGKFLAIAFLARSVGSKSGCAALRRTKLYEAVEFIGRWSMIDVFVVAILSSLVQLSVVVSINPGPAALTFASSVILTMLSARSFDSRLIWDRIEPPEAEGAEQRE